MLFVALLYIAYATTGLAGAAISEHMILPLSNPILCFASVMVGVMSGLFRKIMLFRLPLSFCFGVAVGVLLRPDLHANEIIIGVISVAVALWMASLFLSLHYKYVVICAAILALGVGLSFLLPLSASAVDYAFFAIYGISVTIMLIIACGICASISLTGISLKWDVKEFEAMLPKQAANIFGMFL